MIRLSLDGNDKGEGKLKSLRGEDGGGMAVFSAQKRVKKANKDISLPKKKKKYSLKSELYIETVNNLISIN